jgi:serum/glucocorticoid-regulated kinase 2
VYLVRSKITGVVMALKRVDKATIKNYQCLMTQFHERKNLIRMGNNMHTVNLHACFESRTHFNFLMEYYPGGELFLHLVNAQERLRSSQVKLYFC